MTREKGWYTDPFGDDERWWNGKAWTDDVRIAAPPSRPGTGRGRRKVDGCLTALFVVLGAVLIGGIAFLALLYFSFQNWGSNK